MLDGVPLLATTISFICIFVYMFSKLQLNSIRANWNERRCEPLVIMSASMVPTDPDVDAGAFAVENFEFCIGKMIDASIGLFIAPMLKVFNEQVNATTPITDMIKNLQANAKENLLSPLTQWFDGLWTKFKIIMYQVMRIFINLYSSLDRVFGIATASIFAGMSMYKGIQNAVGFVIQVCITILIILVALVPFLFFVMIPVLPLILTMIGIISATVYSANVSGMSNGFCVAPGTLVATKDGWKKVEELIPGDLLRNGTIEGVLKVKSTNPDCVSIHGVTIASCHLVYENGWISAGEHSAAIPIEYTGLLYCLNTSSREWIVSTLDGELLLRDWEEIPDTPENNKKWESMIYKTLNPCVKGVECFEGFHSSPGRGLLGPDTSIWEFNKGRIPISSVKIGDMIQDSDGYTEVLGIYIDLISLRSGCNSAMWIWKDKWIHPRTIQGSPVIRKGYQLITKSGIFSIEEGTVRDFTEVGIANISQTYPFTLSLLRDRNAEAYDLFT